MRLGVIAYYGLVVLALGGFVILRRRRVAVWLLMTPFLTVTATTLLLYGNLRFRHSAELALVILAAVALDAVWRGQARSPAARRRRGAGAPRRADRAGAVRATAESG